MELLRILAKIGENLKLIERSLEENKLTAETQKHKALVKLLDSYAISQGFARQRHIDSIRPDVLREKELSSSQLEMFIGDAKVSQNETSSNSESVKRFKKYCYEFIDCMKNEKISGGMIALITDNQKSATDWQEKLNKEVAEKVGLLSGFKLCQYPNRRAWIILWKVDRQNIVF